MKNPVTPFNNWILTKIAQFLLTKEGCQIEEHEYTQKGARVIVQDVFGFRYEVEIKLVGRALQGEDNNLTRSAALRG